MDLWRTWTGNKTAQPHRNLVTTALPTHRGAHGVGVGGGGLWAGAGGRGGGPRRDGHHHEGKCVLHVDDA